MRDILFEKNKVIEFANCTISANNSLLWFINQLGFKGSAFILSILQKHFVNLQFNRLFHDISKYGLLI